MKVIDLKTTDPMLNLATEEYLLKQMSGDFFMLWRNSRSVIVGRNQNTYAEINADYVRKHSVPVVRRLTGGGAVFHDLGNLNYTFIEEGAEDKFGNYAAFSAPILEVLRSLSVPAELRGRNDLVINGKKFSGNAQTLWHGRMMHHGTLMFSANVGDMADALRVNSLKIQSKGIKSVKSRVTNISEYLKDGLSVTGFKDLLIDRAIAAGGEPYEPTEADNAAIRELYGRKYSQNVWNFGFDKKYGFSKDTLFSSGLVSVNLDIENGLIANARIFGDFFGICDVSEFEEELVGTRYDFDSLGERLNSIDTEKYFSGISQNQLLSAMF